MKKILFLIVSCIALNGCFQMVALAPSVITGAASGNIAQSLVSYGVSQGVKNATGKTPMEHAVSMTKGKKITAITRDKKIIHSFNSN